MARSQDSDPAVKLQQGDDPDLPDGDEIDQRIYGARLSLGQMSVVGEVVKMAPSQRKALGYPDTGPIAMADIYGVTRGLTDPKKFPRKDGETEDRYCRGLVGKFEGRNLATGEIFGGQVAYLPSGFHDSAVADIETCLGQAGPGGEVKWGWRFVVCPDANLAGYTWKAVNLQPVDKNDPLLGMRKKAASLVVSNSLSSIGAAAVRLPAPSEAESAAAK